MESKLDRNLFYMTLIFSTMPGFEWVPIGNFPLGVGPSLPDLSHPAQNRPIATSREPMNRLHPNFGYRF